MTSLSLERAYGMTSLSLEVSLSLSLSLSRLLSLCLQVVQIIVFLYKIMDFNEKRVGGMWTPPSGFGP